MASKNDPNRLPYVNVVTFRPVSRMFVDPCAPYAIAIKRTHQVTVTHLDQRISRFGSRVSPKRGRMKSVTVVADREFRAEAVLDMAAAKMAAMTSPPTSGLNCVLIK
jgi:hypothetical protein